MPDLLPMFPSDSPPPGARAGLRVRWENLALIAVAIGIVALSVPLVFDVDLASLRPKSAAPPKGTAVPRADADRSTATDAADTAAEVTTLEQANAVVAQARIAMNQGRFDEAAALLGRVGGKLADQSGANQLRNDNAQRQDRYTQRLAEARIAADEQRWGDALAAYDAAAREAPLPADVLAQVEMARTQSQGEADLTRVHELLQQGRTADALALARKGEAEHRTPAFRQIVVLIERDRAKSAKSKASSRPHTEHAPAATQLAATAAAPKADAATPAATPAAATTPAATPTPAGAAVTADPLAAAGNLGLDPATMQQIQSLLNQNLGALDQAANEDPAL